jgi:hypothetical protein
MKTKEKIEQLANDYGKSVGNTDGTTAFDFKLGYSQCQRDMADEKYTEEDMKNSIKLADEYADFKMTQLANHLRNNYQPLAPNQAEWQRISDKKVFRIEEIIEELKK